MGSAKYYFFIEGDTDRAFFEKLIFSVSGMPNRGNFNFIKYAERKINEINGLIKTLSDCNFTYFFITDFDSGPCVTSVKDKQKAKFPSLENDKIFVVLKEIESWYLAGLDEKSSTELGIGNYKETDNISKGDFEGIKPKKFKSVEDFRIETLKRFSIETAKGKNSSFNYSWTKISKILQQ
jgi:hypothetical protein